MFLFILALQTVCFQVTRALWAGPDSALTASHDSTIRLWNVPTSQTLKLLRVHDGPVTGLSLHATGDYVLSTSLDQHWAFSDLRAGKQHLFTS